MQQQDNKMLRHHVDAVILQKIKTPLLRWHTSRIANVSLRRESLPTTQHERLLSQHRWSKLLRRRWTNCKGNVGHDLDICRRNRFGVCRLYGSLQPVPEYEEVGMAVSVDDRYWRSSGNNYFNKPQFKFIKVESYFVDC